MTPDQAERIIDLLDRINHGVFYGFTIVWLILLFTWLTRKQ